jgi:predicted deoxyguanosinetriphosphate triphosphohydrolase
VHQWNSNISLDFLTDELDRALFEVQSSNRFKELGISSKVDYTNRSSDYKLIATSDTKTAKDQFNNDRRNILALPEWNRLKDVYQFAINYADERLKNRETHTLDVKNTAEEIAIRFGLREESQLLAGNIALLHDIGHPPFSHWGEVAIKKALKPYGIEWNHDAAGINIATDWSKTKKNHEGASLSPTLIEGVAKRFWRYDDTRPTDFYNHHTYELPKSVIEINEKVNGKLRLDGFNHIEGQIAAQSDRLAFNVTDLLDGLRVGRFKPEMLKEHFNAAWKVLDDTISDVAKEYAYLNFTKSPNTSQIKAAIYSDVDLMDYAYQRFAPRFREFLMQDLLVNTEKKLRRAIDSGELNDADDIRGLDSASVEFTPEMNEQFRKYAKFCRDKIFTKTAPFEHLVSATISNYVSGKVKLPTKWNEKFSKEEREAEKVRIVCTYITREMTDIDVITHVKVHSPEVYLLNQPDYEVIKAKNLDASEIHDRITTNLKRLELNLGMPLLFEKDLDFSEESSIPVISAAKKFILPVPEHGETIQIKYDGQYRKGEAFRKGDPVKKGNGSIVSGQGIAFFNDFDDQWVAAISGLSGRDRNIVVLNEVTEEQAIKLQAKLDEVGEPEKITPQQLKALLEYAKSLGGNIIMHPSNVAYLEDMLENIPGNKVEEKSSSKYGFKQRKGIKVCRVTIVEGPFELHQQVGEPETSLETAAVIKHPDGGLHIARDGVLARTYRKPDNTPIRYEDVPKQSPLTREKLISNNVSTAEKTIALSVIGSGVSGIAATIHAIQEFMAMAPKGCKLSINIIDSASEIGGPTYNRPTNTNKIGMANPIGILGIGSSASIIEYINKDPERWKNIIPKVNYNPAIGFDPKAIIPHNIYGFILKSYFEDFLANLNKDGTTVNIIRERLVATNTTDEKVELSLSGGNVISSDAVIYGLGNSNPKPIKDKDGKSLAGKNGYYNLDDQAFTPDNVNETDFTVILGTANGACFSSLWAVDHGYTGRFLLVSKNGRVPEVAGESKAYTREILTLDNLNKAIDSGRRITADYLYKLFKQELVVARRKGFIWQDVVDSMPKDTNAIWQMLGEEQQRVFNQKYAVDWGHARYRIPNEHWQAVQELREQGRLDICGGLESIEVNPSGGFDLKIGDKIIHTSKIVNNTGPSKWLEQMPVCAQNLVAQGLAKVHHAGGLDVDNNFRITGANGGTQNLLYALGPIVSGAVYEAMTVPAINKNAGVLAKTVVADLIRRILLPKVQYQDIYIGECKPSKEQVQEYIKGINDKGVNDDPLNPNKDSVIPTTSIHCTGIDIKGQRIYSAERDSLHQEIISNLLRWNPVTKGYEDKVPSDKPSFMCIGGGMSVGMTYMQRLMLNDGFIDPSNTVIITPLAFAPMNEFQVRDHYQHPEKSPILVEEYYDISRKAVAAAIKKGLNVVFVDQADNRQAILDILGISKKAGYESAMVGLTMTPEAYFDASQLWQDKYGRIADHKRGFGDLKEYSQNWSSFCNAFDVSVLFETFFNTKQEELEYTIKSVARAYHTPEGQLKEIVNDAGRYEDFKHRGRFINPDSNTPQEARRGYPYREASQLPPYTISMAKGSEGDTRELEITQNEQVSISSRFSQYCTDGFENRFVNLVMKTQKRRISDASTRAGGE